MNATTCWRCGAPADHDPDPAAHECDEWYRMEEQYAALAAAHDASVAAYERRYEFCDLDWDQDCMHQERKWAALRARAEAAEAALRDGVRDLQSQRFEALTRAANIWERRALAAEAQLAAAREDGARSMTEWMATWEHIGDIDRHLAFWRTWRAAQGTETTA